MGRHVIRTAPRGSRLYFGTCRARRRLPRGQSARTDQAVDFYITPYRILNNGLAGVIVAVPPRLDLTVTESGFTRTAGVTLVF